MNILFLKVVVRGLPRYQQRIFCDFRRFWYGNVQTLKLNIYFIFTYNNLEHHLYISRVPFFFLNCPVFVVKVQVRLLLLRSQLVVKPVEVVYVCLASLLRSIEKSNMEHPLWKYPPRTRSYLIDVLKPY